jgi:enoyl-CoA hydratase
MNFVLKFTLEGVCTLVLNSPPLNLVSRGLTQQLADALEEIGADETIRIVVVRGAGSRAFCAGSDIKEFPALMESGRVVEDKLALENDAYTRLATLPQVTIAAIEGLALGGGGELALCCDYRMMSSSAHIGFPEIHLGTIPGSGGLSRLPRLVGTSRALALILDGNSIPADEALQIGLVDEVAPADQCLERCIARAKLWASRPSHAVRAIKKALLASREDSMRDVTTSLEASRAIFATTDMREGVAAFLEKRSPRFVHR